MTHWSIYIVACQGSGVSHKSLPTGPSTEACPKTKHDKLKHIGLTLGRKYLRIAASKRLTTKLHTWRGPGMHIYRYSPEINQQYNNTLHAVSKN